MKKAEIKAFKEQLLNLRARLRGDVNAMADAALCKTGSEANGDLSSMPIHMADIGSDNYEQFTLSLMQSDEITLESIETAIEKIEDGVFGVCEECAGQISKARLNAIPHAPLCIKCAQKLDGARQSGSTDRLEAVSKPPRRRGQSHFSPRTTKNWDSPRRF